MRTAGRPLLVILPLVTLLHGSALATRIADCPAARYAPDLSTTIGLPFDDPSSPGGAFVVGEVVVLGACPETPAPVTVARHRRKLRARWQTCGPFTRVRLSIVLGPGGPPCDYFVGVIRYRDPSGRRRGLKFPANRVGAG